MGVQPVLIDTSRFELNSVEGRSPLWQGIAIAERILAAAVLALIFPLLAVAGVIIMVLSRRPPLISHQRIGQDGRPLRVLKLRTMWESRPAVFRLNALVEQLPPECVSPVHTKSRDDPRVASRFAGFCRRYSIDELPQLWHVAQGHLALVGPRPLTEAELELYYGAAAGELLRQKPGLSGLWQIRGRSRLSYRARRRLDLFMVRNWSLALYVWILMATVPAVLSGKDAW